MGKANEIKCPCGLRNYMEEEDCRNTLCNDCCPLTIDGQVKTMTNADRIRAMSNEELAEFMRYGSLCSTIQDEGNWCDKRAICQGCLEEWLEQPVGVE